MNDIRKLYLLITLLSLSGCSDNRSSEYGLWQDCYNHYRAKSYRVASTSCEKAFSVGYVRAAWLLGHIHYYNLNNDHSNRESGFQWYLKAAEAGWPQALTYVGESYMYADGVAEDFSKAFHWLTKAAAYQDPDAEFAIGMLFYDGKGRDKDIGSAIAWFKKAADKQHLMSLNNLTWIHATSRHKTFRNLEKASFWAKRLATKLQNEIQQPIFLDTQAAVHALAEEFELAITMQNQAISLLPDDVEESRLLEFQQHLESYQNKKAWLENE